MRYAEAISGNHAEQNTTIMKQTTISIKFPVRLDTDGNGFSYVEDDRFSASCYARNGKAVDTLRAETSMAIDRGLDTVRYGQKCAIGTVDGPVFVVERKYGCWQYSIVGPDRTLAGSSVGSWVSFDSVVQDAEKHASSSFGGIAWKSSF